MKVLMNTITKKILIALMTIIMLTNFIMPNQVHADGIEDTADGLFYLIAKLGDVLLSTMQYMMVGHDQIEYGGEFIIKYSPGMIFANEVLPLDINFLNPNENYVYRQNSSGGKELQRKVFNAGWSTVANGRGFPHPDDSAFSSYYDINKVSNIESVANENYALDYYFNVDGKEYKLEQTRKNPAADWFLYEQGGLENVDNYIQQILESKGYSNSTIIKDGVSDGYDTTYEWLTSDNEYYRLYVKGNKVGNAQSITVTLTDLNSSTVENTDEKISSTAAELRQGISTWYNALRTVALVGLLSVLVYIGIRIILSSTSAQDKAKYKTMLKDWVVAICILFVLHYLMVFMLEFTGNLNELIKDNLIKEGDSYATTGDKLISSVRQKIGTNIEESIKNDDVPGYAIMYLALVILTGTFTFQYLKRVVFMAFLTIIAPLIALTYPLDKMKDSKAQAFSYWLKEYIFNCLIQPVHLLLYIVLINNAMTFATQNVLYGIVTLAFMVPAEKFIKEMFGLKSGSPTGTLSTAVGGAMVMSMLQKIKGKPPKDEAGKAGAGASNNPNGIRTANQNGTAGAQTAALQNQTRQPQAGQTQTAQPQTGQTQTGQRQAGQRQSGQRQAGQTQNGQTGQNQGQPTQNNANQNGAGTTTSRNTLGGMHALGKRYIYGANALKSHAGRLTGVSGAVLGAGIGLAAQVADGDLFESPEKAAGQIAMATGIGYAAGNSLAQNTVTGISNLPNNIRNAGDNIADTYDQGSLSAEEYQNRKFARQFFRSDEYKAITQDSSINQTNIRERTQQFLDNGVTDAKVIREALQNNISADDYKQYSDLGATSPKDIKALAQNNISADKLDKIQLYSGDTSIDKIKRYSTIAEAAKTAGIVGNNSAADIRNFKLNFAAGHNIDDAEAEKLYKKLLHYWN